MPKHITAGEKIAVAMCKMLSDLHLDLDMVGYYVYRTMPPLMYNRFQEIAHAAEHEKQMHQNKEYMERMHNIGL
jgi:hypothetical protein